jgi:hypothetical protein
MLNDCIIGVCRNSEEECYKYHVCSVSGWDTIKANEPILAHDPLGKKRKHRGRASTWDTIKQLRQYKTQLEIENEKITVGTNEYDRAITLLNDTLGSITKNDPNLEISSELQELLE